MRKKSYFFLLCLIVLSISGCQIGRLSISVTDNKDADSINEKDKSEQVGISDNEQGESKEEAEILDNEQVEYEDGYMPGWVYSTSLDTYVHYARVIYDKYQGCNVVAVGCTIRNYTANDLLFVASYFYSLNNNGIITNATYSEYDNQTIAPDGSFFTEIIFNCPNVKKSGDTIKMTLRVENSQLYLHGVTPDDKTLHELPGVYMDSDGDDIYIISDNEDGTYYVIWIDDFLQTISEHTITLDNNNEFSVQNGDFIWDPTNGCIYQYVYSEEEYDKNNPLTKQY